MPDNIESDSAGSFKDGGMTVVEGANKTSFRVVILGVLIMIILQIATIVSIGSDDDDASVTIDLSDGAGVAMTDSGTVPLTTPTPIKSTSSAAATAAGTLNTIGSQIGQLTGNTDSSGAVVSDITALRNKRDDVVIIAVHGEWPPYCYEAYETMADGNSRLAPKGFLYEMAQNACRVAGVTCDFPITGKWTECWDENDQVGRGLLNGMYDMCLCWTVTPGRLARTKWPTNADRGWTTQPEGGLMGLNKWSTDTTVQATTGQTQQDWFKMDWTDGCDGKSMIQYTDANGDLVWGDDCDENGSCAKQCPQGKIKIGYIRGWALKPVSFTWITNQYTQTNPDKDRVLFQDEMDDGSGTGTMEPIWDYNQLAKALLTEEIDLAYTYANVIDAMSGQPCAICSDSNVWSDGSLKFYHNNLYFSAGGASGFFKYGDVALRDLISKGAEDYINTKDEYCPLCIKYWPDQLACEGHCIGCGAGNAVDYCQNAGGSSG